ncbi:GTP cyclohydrolase I FolE [Paraferrimonas sp. SM1919]|uniref:GTP cyclohydrolase I FolE n=1 Tax=Paraferrimonas sp. SM1919 TaxID=2662263 RepID=UPI0013D68C67|nr:GTP cyclohydrolase I FolE [Paraferrimonas sp. SM1919]
MRDPNKCDPILGAKVEAHLRSIGMHTPTKANQHSETDKQEIIAGHFRGIMQALGLDLSDDSLIDTPTRVGKMMASELMWGLQPENFPKCTAIENKMGYNEMVCETGVTTLSQCEHHFVTIDGYATVAYIPKNRVLGLSKISRIVEYFSRRPQVQERLTVQIAEALKCILETDDIAVAIIAKHYCVKARGVEDHAMATTTTSLHGCFKQQSDTRKEFLTYHQQSQALMR